MGPIQMGPDFSTASHLPLRAKLCVLTYLYLWTYFLCTPPPFYSDQARSYCFGGKPRAEGREERSLVFPDSSLSGESRVLGRGGSPLGASRNVYVLGGGSDLSQTAKSPSCLGKQEREQATEPDGVTSSAPLKQLCGELGHACFGPCRILIF